MTARTGARTLPLVLALGLPLAGPSGVRAQPLTGLEGDLHVFDSAFEPADRIGGFRLESDGTGDLREAPGPAALAVPGAGAAAGELVGQPVRANEVRRVDPATGRPLAGDAPVGASCFTGLETGCLPSDQCRPAAGGPLAPCSIPGSVDLFRVLNLSGGILAGVEAGLLSFWNSTNSVITGDPIAPEDVLSDADVSLSELLANVLAGNSVANLFLSQGIAQTSVPFVTLSADPCDGFLSDCVTPGPAGSSFLGEEEATSSSLLSPAQQGLLGCGEFRGTNCEVEGVGLLLSEASALLQCLGSVGPDWDFGDAEVAQPCTVGHAGSDACVRRDDDTTSILPGCRGPGDSDYDANVDGDPSGLVHPLTDQALSSEMAALSFNFVMSLVVFSALGDPSDPFPDPLERLDPADPLRLDGCSFRKPQLCRSLLGQSFAEERADDPSGPPRRRWLWETGAEYDVANATGRFLEDFLGWSLHAIGPEPSRAGGAGEGLLFLLAPPEEQPPCEAPPFPVPDSPFVVTSAGCDGDSGTADDRVLGAAYGVVPVPEPTSALLRVLAFGAVAWLARRRRVTASRGRPIPRTWR